MKTVKEINNYVGYKVEIFPTEEQKSIFNRIGEEYWWGLYKQLKNVI